MALARPAPTNIAYLTLPTGTSGAELVRALGARGVRVLGGGDATLRVVTHHQVAAADVPRIVEAFDEAIAEARRSTHQAAALYS